MNNLAFGISSMQEAIIPITKLTTSS
jgi:hypothetical protein